MIDGKVYRGDIYVKMSDYSHALIEMNNMSDFSIINRNMVNLLRVHNQVLKQGIDDQVLEYYRLKGLNFNNFNSDYLFFYSTYTVFKAAYKFNIGQKRRIN